MTNIAIQADGLSKRYRIGMTRKRVQRSRGDVFNNLVAWPVRNFNKLRSLSHFGDGQASNVVWALKDFSFEVREGEVVGIVGHNGAGKTTLLKILSRITEPTEGEAVVRGRVGSLLEVGTGFHRELTGRENVFLNGAVLGMTRSEIRRKFDDIVEFAGVEKFIDTPVKRYSPGMKVRLGFSVAAHLEPEILLVDEVLAVGDAKFQAKCLGKMDEVAKEGRTVLFVSHNMGTLTRLCSRAVWIENGGMKLDGDAREVVGTYLTSTGGGGAAWQNARNGASSGHAQITSARVLSNTGEPVGTVPFSDEFKLEIAYEVIESHASASILGRMSDSAGNVVWTSLDTDSNGFNGVAIEPGQYTSICHIPGGLLKPGRYYFSIGTRISSLAFARNERKYRGEVHENVLSVDISEIGFELDELDRPGIVAPSLQWETQRVEAIALNGHSVHS